MAIVLSNQHNRFEPVGASPQIPVRRSAHASAVDYFYFTGGLKIKKRHQRFRDIFSVMIQSTGTMLGHVSGELVEGRLDCWRPPLLVRAERSYTTVYARPRAMINKLLKFRSCSKPFPGHFLGACRAPPAICRPMIFMIISARDSKARREDGEYVRLDEEAG